MNSEGVFLTWNDSRRSSSICARLGLERVVIAGERRGFTRHVLGALGTVIFLIRKRPEVVWFQFSLVLAAVLWLYSNLRSDGRGTLVADLHTKAMRRSGPIGTRSIIQALKGRALRRCLAVLVTNRQNARYVEERFGGYTLVLPDPLPQVPNRVLNQQRPPGNYPDVVFICSFASDEPIALMIEAANRLCDEAEIAFTGNPKNIRPAQRKAIARVARLTGFLSGEDYWQVLKLSRCVVVLSDEPACLQCGAYEAIAVGKRPIVADDSEARHLFGELAIYARLDAGLLVAAIRTALAESSEIRGSNRADAYECRWQKQWQDVERRLVSRGLPRSPGFEGSRALLSRDGADSPRQPDSRTFAGSDPGVQ